ncbi:MAG: DUF1579 family protein [Planctomycetota bacterium]
MRLLSLIASFAAFVACGTAAQDPTTPPAKLTPSPLDPLRAFVGIWDVTGGVWLPGQDEAPLTGTEYFQMVCGDRWLKSMVRCEVAGARYEAVSLTGWDPLAGAYVGFFFDSDDSRAQQSFADYAPKSRTWSSKFVPRPREPDSRSVLVWEGEDVIKETGYCTDETGAERRSQEFVRRRRKLPAGTLADRAPLNLEPSASAKTARAAEAVASTDEQTETPISVTDLSSYLGTWDATELIPQAEGDPIEAKGVEVNTAVCNGRWVLSEYRGSHMGEIVERLAIFGYDNSRFTVHWVDSRSPHLTQLEGGRNAEHRTITYRGAIRTPDGQEVEYSLLQTWRGQNQRTAEFGFGTAQDGRRVTVSYERRPDPTGK